jgi:hypothetical protein
MHIYDLFTIASPMPVLASSIAGFKESGQTIVASAKRARVFPPRQIVH